MEDPNQITFDNEHRHYWRLSQVYLCKHHHPIVFWRAKCVDSAVNLIIIFYSYLELTNSNQVLQLSLTVLRLMSPNFDMDCQLLYSTELRYAFIYHFHWEHFMKFSLSCFELILLIPVSILNALQSISLSVLARV